MSDFLLAVISFVIILGPLIFIHELGHFIACRLVGVTVLEFGLGLPPRAAKLFERNGTEFTLNWLPVGGFVRPLGEDFIKPVGPEAAEKDRARYAQYQAELEALGKKTSKIKAMMDAGPWQRMFFLVAGAGMNFVGAIVILIVAGLLGTPSPAPVIAGAAPKSPAANVDLKFGDVVTAVNGQAVADADAVNKALEAGKANPVVLTIERDGKSSQVTISPKGSNDVFPAQGVLVIEVAKGSPADGVFEVGDIIRQIGPVGISATESLQKAVTAQAGQPVSITLYRNGEAKTVNVTPRKNPPQGQGPVGIGLTQLTYNTSYGLAVEDSTNGRITPMPLGESILYGFRQTGSILQRLISFPVDLVRGLMTIQEARPVSIVGITQIGSEALTKTIQDRQAYWVLNFAALISIALGFTNLLPIPGLDGGRILFVIVELLRGKPMDPEREGMIHLVGLMIILGLFAIMVVNDIVNPIGQVLH
jgi:regulator of sigma E protease